MKEMQQLKEVLPNPFGIPISIGDLVAPEISWMILIPKILVMSLVYHQLASLRCTAQHVFHLFHLLTSFTVWRMGTTLCICILLRYNFQMTIRTAVWEGELLIFISRWRLCFSEKLIVIIDFFLK